MSRRRPPWALLYLCAALAAPLPASADDYSAGASWASLTSDRLASDIGDQITVLIEESATASDTAANSVSRKTTGSGELTSGGSHLAGRATLNLDSGFDGSGQATRSHTMVASVSVTVVGVAANGDLWLAGEQSLNINGERTHIRLRGRVRRVDIASDNTVASTRLADAQIDYSGQGLVGRAARPGLLTRVLTGFGLF